MKLDNNICKICDKAIVISGGARSGTTIMGKIFHSFQEVEYAFEPPMLFSLFALLPDLQEEEWKLLYETYLYEEFLMNALAGRGLNCNREDDSSIYRVKAAKIIEERLNRSLGKSEAEDLARKSSIVYKIPDVVAFLPKLMDYYPGTRVVLMTRKAPEVFNSIREKGWFRASTLLHENLNWPNRFIHGLRIPFWVDPKDSDDWYHMDELHRIAYYYLRVNESIKDIPGCIRIRYDDLVKDPRDTIRSLSEHMNLTWGEKTEEILTTVRRTHKQRDPEILTGLEPKTRDLVFSYSDIS